MEPQFNINTQGSKTTPRPLYLVQVNPNVRMDLQALPLDILENDLDADLLLPMLQQKHGQLLVIEPLKEPTYMPNECQKKEENGMALPNAPINSSIPATSIKIESSTTKPTNNSINIKEYIKNITVSSSPPSSYKNKETSNDTLPRTEGVNNFEIDINFDNMTMTCRPQYKIKNYVHISDAKALPRAVAVLPAALQIRGNWISPRRTLSIRVRFGPVQGIRKSITRSEAQMLLSNSTTPVFLVYQDEENVLHIDVSDKDKSNWMGLLPLGDPSTPTTATTANVWLYEENHELYVLTTQPICARRPLRLGYSKKYVEDHNIPLGPPVLDLETVPTVQWRCSECDRVMASAALLQRHTDVYHKDYIRTSRSYRCRYCKRPFGRLFTLKRHQTGCLQKPQNSPEKSQESTETNQRNEPEPDISSVLEDNRIPSDESFHNFTNSLDFSTNLFDTDRIAGLDISSNSRPDSELNPYSIGFRDENGLSNDLGFTKLSNTLETDQSNESNQEQKKPMLETCAYCDQVVVKENKIKHLRQCPSRLICECGRVFRHKGSLAQHIHTCHPTVTLEKPLQGKKKREANDKEMPYRCQECPLGFKRRGMLVNHLWRVHKMISTIPVEKKVRHYPCVGCSKIYRSANKRDRHVRVHHPGAEKPFGQWIEGGVKCCQPASCPECPRQYASRAKLLQHMRHQHPHLAETTSKETAKKLNSKSENQRNERENTPEHGMNYSSTSINMLPLLY